MEHTITTGLANLGFESPLDRPYTPPSTGYPGAIPRTRRKELIELAKEIRKPFGPTAKKHGIVYAARTRIFQRYIVKVGFSAQDSPKRVNDIENRCKQPVDQYFLTPGFVGAYKAEQIVHKVLAPQACEIFNCGCWGPNREPGIHLEWFEESLDWVKALVLIVYQWMVNKQPYEYKPKSESEPESGSGNLKEDWDKALTLWELGLSSRNPLSVAEFFILGPGICEQFSAQLSPRSPLPRHRSTGNINRERNDLDTDEHDGKGKHLVSPRPRLPKSQSSPANTNSAGPAKTAPQEQPTGTNRVLFGSGSSTRKRHSSNRIIDFPDIPKSSSQVETTTTALMNELLQNNGKAVLPVRAKNVDKEANTDDEQKTGEGVCSEKYVAKSTEVAGDDFTHVKTKISENDTSLDQRDLNTECHTRTQSADIVDHNNDQGARDKADLGDDGEEEDEEEDGGGTTSPATEQDSNDISEQCEISAGQRSVDDEQPDHNDGASTTASEIHPSEDEIWFPRQFDNARHELSIEIAQLDDESEQIGWNHETLTELEDRLDSSYAPSSTDDSSTDEEDLFDKERFDCLADELTAELMELDFEKTGYRIGHVGWETRAREVQARYVEASRVRDFGWYLTESGSESEGGDDEYVDSDADGGDDEWTDEEEDDGDEDGDEDRGCKFSHQK